MARKRMKHLYKYGAKSKMLKEFEKRYGKKKGAKIYGAVVGKIKRLRSRRR